FSDNFDTADAGNFDGSDLTGRLSGTLAADVVFRSWGAQQAISGNQLSLPAAGNSGVRFENAAGPFGGANRFNWAAGTTGAEILAAGGFTVTFDWTPADNTSTNWISYQVGTVNADSGNLTDDDYGILFRQNGNTERFDNTVNLTAGGSFTATLGVPRQVKIVYAFSSFADGETVNVVSSVDGVEVANDNFTWDGNGGEMRMELGNNDAGQLIDNLTVSTNENAVYSMVLDNTIFGSSLVSGEAVGDFKALFNGTEVTSTFTLVPGEGDSDNGKFQISGNTLQAGGFDFTDAGSTDGQQFSVRVLAEDNSGPDTTEEIFLLTIVKDDDADDLVDDWELAWAGNLVDLSGLGGDFDGDNLSDLAEYQISLGTFAGVPAYPDIDPTKKDTDDDTLDDDVEVTAPGIRPPTNPTLADTDQDGLSDTVEDNGGVFVSASQTGTNPALIDSDLDGARDPWEIDRGTDPSSISSFPPSDSSAVTLTQITTDASSEIDPAKSYTHAISGGQAVTVNGVSFEALSTTETPANFVWDTGIYTMNQVLNNNGDWLPANGGVNDLGLQDLLNDFVYSGTGTNGGASQTYTLSGLTPGVTYDLRLYIRLWDTDGSGRNIDLTFINGGDTVVPFGALAEDRPGILLGTGNDHDAYFLNYQYTAQSDTLQIEAGVHVGALVPNGSFHLYGLTNEVSTAPAGDPVITQTLFLGTGQFAMGFSATPLRDYQVTKSLDLASGFLPLVPPLEATTDVNGAGQVIIPAADASDSKAFYRIELLP
ncbi:hypothetical protein N9Z83_02815, partial [Akkermansiaceae bacterium]|nr:hypothetical protein [Akkermansiaceae bacterium]